MNPLESINPKSEAQDADDVAKEGYASGAEDLPGSYGASHDADVGVPKGGNPATTMEEYGFDD